MKITIDKPISELLPLEVKCSDTLCDDGFHFLTSNKIPKNGNLGDCPDCGKSVIDWERIYSGNPADFQYKLDSLNKELLRHVCWCNKIDESAIIRARDRGKQKIVARARQIIQKKISKIPTSGFDFQCTPKKGSEIIYYAQHATACCCRKCIERWHNIPMNRILTPEQVDYFVDLITYFIEKKVNNLTIEGLNPKAR